MTTLSRSLSWLAGIGIVTFALGVANLADAQAAINEISINVGDVTPNPIPVGSNATVSADFWLSSDTGPITVGLQLSADPGFGSISIDSTSSELTNCQTTTSTITCDWDGDSVDSPQTIAAIIAVNADVSPYSGGLIEGTAESASEANQTYAISNWIQTAPPAGTTSFSGTVITSGGTPVEGACIFVLSTPQYAFPAISDADGNWSLTGLPDDWSFAVAAIPAFIGAYGPCADNGPPAPPAAGELQPVFYSDIWLDLADPIIANGLGDPFDFAIAEGATAFSESASGLVSCLSTASSSTVPRPSCVPPTTTTTSTTTTSTTTTMSPTTSTPSGGGVGGVTSTTAVDILPVTGASTTPLGLVGALMLLLGAGVLRATRTQTTHASQRSTPGERAADSWPSVR